MASLNATGAHSPLGVVRGGRGLQLGGTYQDGSGRFQAFVVTEMNGIWGKAKEVPGTAALNSGGCAAAESSGATTTN